MKRKSIIPPITSTGRKVRNPNARLAGLSNISIGRYISEMKKQNDTESEDSFDFTKFTKSSFNKKSNKNIKSFTSEPICCLIKITEEDNLIIKLDFSELKIIDISDQNNILTDKGILQFKTFGDIFEYEVIQKSGSTIFRDEAYIPTLLTVYDDSTMKISIKDNSVTCIYDRTNTNS